MGRPSVPFRTCRGSRACLGAGLGVLLLQGLLLAVVPCVNQISAPGRAPEEEAGLLQAPSETSPSGAGRWVGQREQLASVLTPHPKQREAESRG